MIGFCWGDDLTHWDVKPLCLDPKGGAEWERGGLYKPCLVEENGTYYLFYNAKTDKQRGWRKQTGVATSKDLKNWTRYEQSPCADWRCRLSSDPCVLVDGSTWVMFYYGLGWQG